jgi:glycosyltransferase involved in cell wall biosynthesis
MKISIITVVYNNVATIEDAINSVLLQTYNNIEYIIIDGGSNDGTLDILNKYKNRLSKLISEPDKGIYDAMNKGLKIATGEVVGILNSDDLLNCSTII